MKNGNALNLLSGLVKMTKHEGNGNDFLVLLDIEDHFHFSDDTIRWLCDRRRGVGADGFIRAVGLPGESVSVIDKVQKTASGIAMKRAAASDDSTFLTVEYGVGHTGKNHKDGGYDAFMELTNADGTRAEMSGNGIRCLAQAIYDFRNDGDNNDRDNSTGGLGVWCQTAKSSKKAPTPAAMVQARSLRVVDYVRNPAKDTRHLDMSCGERP